MDLSFKRQGVELKDGTIDTYLYSFLNPSYQNIIDINTYLYLIQENFLVCRIPVSSMRAYLT